NAEALEVAFHPLARRARGDSYAQAGLARRRRQLGDPGQDRLGEHHRRPALDAPVEHVLRERAAHALLEVAPRIEGRSRRADDLDPPVVRQLLSVRLVHLEPREVDRLFGVEDQAVEVKYECPDQWRSHPHTKALVSPHYG